MHNTSYRETFGECKQYHPDEEAFLVLFAQAGFVAARHKVITAWIPFAIDEAKKWKQRCTIPSVDWTEWALLGLTLAIDQHDVYRGSRFSTTAGYYIYQQLLAAIPEDRMIRIPRIAYWKTDTPGHIRQAIEMAMRPAKYMGSLKAKQASRYVAVPSAVHQRAEQQDDRQWLYAQIKTLSEVRRRVILERLKGKTQLECAQAMGVSKAWISTVEIAAKKILREKYRTMLSQNRLKRKVANGKDK